MNEELSSYIWRFSLIDCELFLGKIDISVVHVYMVRYYGVAWC